MKKVINEHPPSPIAASVVTFYLFWHGKLGLPGAGWTLRFLATRFESFQRLPIKFNGIQLVLDPRDASCFYWLNERCGDPFEEVGLVAALRKCLTPESVVWDVGANCGLFSYKASLGEKFTEWHVFEPNPFVAEIATAALNNSNIALHQTALSDACEDKMLTVAQGASLKGTLSPEITQRSGQSFAVKCLTGDFLVYGQKMRPPSLIKIDAEGHEKQVIEGMKRLIREHRPTIFFEHLSLTDEDVTKMNPDGYRLFTVDKKSGDLVEFSRSRGHNSVFVPADSLEKLRAET